MPTSAKTDWMAERMVTRTERMTSRTEETRLEIALTMEDMMLTVTFDAEDLPVDFLVDRSGGVLVSDTGMFDVGFE